MPNSIQPLATCYPVFTYCTRRTTSLLVVANTHPLLSLVCQQLPHPLLVLPPFHTPQIKLQYLHRWHQQHLPSSSGSVTTGPIKNGTYLSLYIVNFFPLTELK